MSKSLTFVEAFLFKPDYGRPFILRARVYEYVDTVYVTDDVLVVCGYVNSKGEKVYKVLSQRKYRDERVYFL